jgi:serine/threonine protein kinase
VPEQILAGKYIVQDEIARGGMGVIYKALDRTLNRVVAVKVVHAHLSGDPSFAERFLREARAMARLHHDHIVTIFSVEDEGGAHYLVMEYFPGGNLRALLRGRPHLPIRESVNLTIQVASALAFAHSHQIIHRDIKPANILVDQRNKVKLTDFGIAAALDEAGITSTGQVIGTPEYMSPEQAQVRSSMGAPICFPWVVFYELVTGRTPFHDIAKTAIIGKLAYAQEELRLTFPSSVPSLLQGVIHDLLRRNPDERIPDAETLASQLSELLYTLPESAHPPVLSDNDATMVASAPSQSGTPQVPAATEATVIAPGVSTPKTAPPHSRAKTPDVAPAPLPPPPAVPQLPTSIQLEETTLLPSRPSTSVSKLKSPPSPLPPTPPPLQPPQRTFPLAPIFLGGGVVVLVLTGFIYYLSNSPVAPPERIKTSPIPSRADTPIVLGNEYQQEPEKVPPKPNVELEKERERLAQDQERVKEKARLAQIQKEKEESEQKELARKNDARRKQLEAERPEKERERQRQNAQAVSQQEETQVAKVFPDPQLQSLLGKFKSAYEHRDLGALRALSQMTDSRVRNVEVMFSNYQTINASIKNIAQTQDGATATLVLDKVITPSGETVDLPPIARTVKLQIPRAGAGWDKIIW